MNLSAAMFVLCFLICLFYSEPLKLGTTFSGPPFFTKMLESKNMIIYLLAFYPFDDIK